MTYVVTENCIKCKYTDCVEVCPVDCFYEGPNFLAIDPDDPVMLYALACIYATIHDIDEALDHLERAVDNGFTHKLWIKQDSYLNPIRENSRFQALIKRLD